MSQNSLQEEEWFFAHRALLLTSIAFTHTGVAQVVKQKDAEISPIDLLFAIRHNGLPTDRLFGVEVKAALESETLSIDSLATLSDIEKQRLKEVPFPVLLMLFTMEHDKGYFRWVRHPEINGEVSSLRFHASGVWETFDDATINDIVNDIRRWYDARTKFRNSL